MSASDSELPPPTGSGLDLPKPAASALGSATDTEARWFNQRVAGLPAWGLFGAAVLIWIAVVAIILRTGGDGSSELSFRVTAPSAASSSAATSSVPAIAATTDVTTTGPSSTATAIATTTEPADGGATGTTTARQVIERADASATSVASTPPSTTSDSAVDATTDAVATTEPPTSTAPPVTETTAAATTEPVEATTTTTTTTTTTPPTTTTTTTPPTTTSTTAPPTTTTVAGTPEEPAVGISEPVTVTGSNGEQLTVTPRQGPCRYGPECFVASFRIDGFSYQPQEFVCEFSSGARYVFRFSSAGADPACSTLDVPDSIVVIVGALRSDPVTIGEQLPSSS
ncbi:MAG: hypothetical protein HKN41_05550 [Ilumatobacter sp.]|nr:hypothetical protein [Ilumatobacter sp.]